MLYFEFVFCFLLIANSTCDTDSLQVNWTEYVTVNESLKMSAVPNTTQTEAVNFKIRQRIVNSLSDKNLIRFSTNRKALANSSVCNCDHNFVSSFRFCMASCNNKTIKSAVLYHVRHFLSVSWKFIVFDWFKRVLFSNFSYTNKDCYQLCNIRWIKASKCNSSIHTKNVASFSDCEKNLFDKNPCFRNSSKKKKYHHF